MTTLRLNKELLNEIEKLSETYGVSKSEIIRRSIREFVEKKQKNNPWELGKDLFGKYSLDDPNLSENAKEIFKSKIKKKYK